MIPVVEMIFVRLKFQCMYNDPQDVCFFLETLVYVKPITLTVSFHPMCRLTLEMEAVDRIPLILLFWFYDPLNPANFYDMDHGNSEWR